MLKKWFTIIELVIVLIIIWILFSVWLNFSWDKIDLIKNQQYVYKFIDKYNNFYIKNLQTKRINWKTYNKLQIFITNSWNYIQASYLYANQTWQKISDPTFFSWNNYQDFFKLPRWNFIISWNQNITITFKPLSNFCQIFLLDWNNSKPISKIKFYIKFDDQKKYCFIIKQPLCQLQKIKCEWL